MGFNITNRKSNSGYINKLIIELVVFVFLFVILLNSSKNVFLKKNDDALDYNEKSSTNYFVALKANEFYETDKLPEGMDYIANLIDNIELSFDYIFSASKPIDYNATYKISAFTKIYSEDKKNVLFEKEVVLSPEKAIKMDQTANYNFKENIVLDYEEFNKLAKQFKSSYGLTSTADLTVVLYVNSYGKSSEYKDEINLNSQSLVKIPLAEKTVKVSINTNNISNSGSLKEKKINNISIINIAIFGASTVGVIVTLIFIIKTSTKILNGRSKYDVNLSRILKENDSIIVNVDNNIDINSYQIVNVLSFEELRDVHDNLGIPIIFKENIKGKESYFYIISDNIIYLFILKEETNIDWDSAFKNGNTFIQ